MKKALFFPLQISLCTVGCLYASSSITHAQVTPDGTVNTQINQDGNSAVITGGETRGSNLFHSFQDFSVGTGNEAFFNNANDISNIFSRVTGGNISNIDGAIRANAGASLFLINPAGIIFGENARLDIGGSFYGSTASSVLFEDGEFSAADLENPPLLTVNAPIGLGFRSDPGDITVRGNGQGIRTTNDLIDNEDALRVNSDKTFALVGGNVTLEGGVIKTAGGNIELGSVEGNEQVSLNPTNSDFSLNYEDTTNFRDLRFTGAATIDVSGLGAGNVRVQGKNITLAEGSVIEANTLGSLPGGQIEINASNSTELLGLSSESDPLFTGIFAFASPEATGDGGDIQINTSSLVLTDIAQIGTQTEGEANAGNIDIKASDFVILSNFSNLSDTSSFSLIISLVEEGATGNAGNVSIEAKSLTINENSQVGTGTFGAFNDGDAGNTLVIATDFVEIRDEQADGLINGIFALQGANNSTGRSGDLFVNTSRLSISGEDSQISVSNFGSGDAGDINLEIRELIIEGGAELQSITFGDGNAGNINIEASESIQVSGSLLERGFLGGIFASAIGGGTGDGGDISISTDNLVVQDLGTISVGNFQTTGELEPGLGNVGNIGIEANNITLDNGDITAASNASIFGGNVSLETSEDIILRNNSVISVQAFQEAGGGSLFIDSRFVVAFPSAGTGSDLVANADVGNAGQIILNAEQTFGLEVGTAIDSNNNFIENNSNDIDASSNEGIGGNISINIINVVDPLQGVTELPQNIDLPEQTSQQACEANREIAAKNGFTINGKGGILPEPGLPLNSLNVTVNGENNPTSTTSTPIETAQGKIQPARGVKVTESGEVILTAYRTNNSGERIPEKRNCG
ncbi:filamentous hemagglutinin N-terminal domain-containing protein [Waterburya agarophytonicola K14]|uniref:Filamentous hemagglutinin N-terminal domain-containing protein n=1 Tax=Waterburya agarophytonicola KI4 TaxID=2874699 RepID=A0A964FGH6_9CYAN|nr:filamentous hemagglutinin N-terminal domain-containing protein [Waterburya agarophytonicola]MCC0178031.1 filamentous hemagglutinin N-terminal domain-containing protein [Waterburya agarophytonicola KI4]